jgi:hypothetical protein
VVKRQKIAVVVEDGEGDQAMERSRLLLEMLLIDELLVFVNGKSFRLNPT